MKCHKQTFHCGSISSTISVSGVNVVAAQCIPTAFKALCHKLLYSIGAPELATSGHVTRLNEATFRCGRERGAWLIGRGASHVLIDQSVCVCVCVSHQMVTVHESVCVCV